MLCVKIDKYKDSSVINEPTEKEKDQGYQICECGKNVHLLQAGFECRHIKCVECGYSVVDREQFFKFHVGSEFLSK